jgi:DNA-binding PadR family transcriptional regulator
MYELVILAFLMRGPFHGYLIAKVSNDMIGPYARLSNGRLYPLLERLEQDGLIAAADGAAERGGDRGGDRRQRTFKITEAGRRRFHQLMLDTTSNPGEYQQIFWYKLPVLRFLEPAERLHVLDHYLTFCQTHIFHITGEMEDLKREVERKRFMSPEDLDATLQVMRHMVRRWEGELEDARSWREREVAAGRATAVAPESGLSAKERTDVDTAAERAPEDSGQSQ